MSSISVTLLICFAAAAHSWTLQFGSTVDVGFLRKCLRSAAAVGTATLLTGGLVVNADIQTLHRESQTFSQFLKSLDDGSISKVVFNGINPKSVTAYFKDGDAVTVGEAEGFPAVDDPLSPSGPTQVLARVQHTPGVVCEQDISSALNTLKSKRQRSMIPMLTHSPYPKTYAYDPKEYKGGEDTKFLDRYSGKDSL